MFTRILCCLVLSWLSASLDVRADELFAHRVQPLLEQSCVGCHGRDGEVNGDVDLTAIPNLQSLSEQADLLAALIEVIEFQEMPPEDEPQLAADDRKQLLDALKAVRATAANPAGQQTTTPIRRMNRFQYNNAVVDLFQLNCVVFTLPERMMREHRNYFQPETRRMADVVTVGSRPLGKSQLIEPRLDGVAPFPQDLRAEHGFDNRGDHLSLSPLLMESFLKLSQSITHSPDFTAKHVGIWPTFFAAPAETEDLRPTIEQRLRPFLTRAFRGPVEANLLARYTNFALAQLERGADFTDAMRAVAGAAIASPRFFYIYEQAAATPELERLSELELASRLSFFLWGSLPDDELLQLAVSGQLGQDDVLAAQVERLLKDRKLKRFCDSFPAQWLQLERIISSVPNPERFPDFYYAKYRDSMHMMLEPLLLFETVLIENQPLTQLIDSSFTYRSLVLREAYREEIPAEARQRGRAGEVTTLTFERLPITDRRYGGVITNAAVMTMTSGPDRTQPITRGAWLATVIFNDPPDPPPADVPPLPDKPTADEAQLTLRERLALHRQRADCRGCHEQIDPLGFALENFNPIGVWRAQYDNGRDIDVSGRLFREHAFADVVEFKAAILAEKDRFLRGFAGHMLSFALARELQPADAIAVEQIAAATAADHDRIQTLIQQIVLSEPFRHKRKPPSQLDAHVRP